jgi:hypothetical protein
MSSFVTTVTDAGVDSMLSGTEEAVTTIDAEVEMGAG